MSGRFTFVSLSVLFVFSVISGKASASEVNDRAAIDCFQEGKTLFKSEQYTEAAAKFREAYDLKPAWKLFYNIAQSEAAAKRHGLALEAFERFLSEGGDDIIETRRDQVLSEVERLRKMVGFLKVQAPEGTLLKVDGVVRGTAPVLMALPVAVGTRHEVQGELGGEIVGHQAFRVTGGQTVSITLGNDADAAPEPAPESTANSDEQSDSTVVPPPAESMETTPNRSPLVIPGWAVLGTGAAAVVAGGVLGGIALSTNRNLSEKCDGYCPEYDDDDKKVTRMATASTALIAAGGTALVTGFVLVFLGKRKEHRESGSFAVLPVIDRHHLSAGLEWRF